MCVYVYVSECEHEGFEGKILSRECHSGSCKKKNQSVSNLCFRSARPLLSGIFFFFETRLRLPLWQDYRVVVECRYNDNFNFFFYHIYSIFLLITTWWVKFVVFFILKVTQFSKNFNLLDGKECFFLFPAKKNRREGKSRVDDQLLE